MTKTKTAEALTRMSLKKAASLQHREALANLAAAATVMKASALFGDMDFVLGLMEHVATLPAAKRLKMIEVGRAERLRLLPAVQGDAGLDLIARIPGDLPDLPEIILRLVGLGFQMNRKRKGSNFVEYTGSSDEAAVRAIVEPVGGCVTAIASPSHAEASLPSSDRDEEAAMGEPPADEVAPDANAGGDRIPAGEHEPDMHAGEAGEDRAGADAWVPDDEGSENFPGAIPAADGGHSDSAPFSGP